MPRKVGVTLGRHLPARHTWERVTGQDRRGHRKLGKARPMGSREQRDALSLGGAPGSPGRLRACGALPPPLPVFVHVAHAQWPPRAVGWRAAASPTLSWTRLQRGEEALDARLFPALPQASHTPPPRLD